MANKEKPGCGASLVGIVVIPLICIGLAALAQKSCESGTTIGRTVGVSIWILLAVLVLALLILKALSS